MEIFNDEAVPDYAQLSDYYSQQGYRDAEGEVKLVEAEDFIIASDSTIMADFDKSDANTSPNDPALLYYNILPGARFQSVGQWVKWHLTGPRKTVYMPSAYAPNRTPKAALYLHVVCGWMDRLYVKRPRQISFPSFERLVQAGDNSEWRDLPFLF